MTRDDLPEDELMTRLGAVLHTEADRYEPSPGSLARIQERAPVPAGRSLFRWFAPLAAAAVFVAVASAIVLLPGGDHTATPAPGTSTPLPQPTADPTPTSEPAPSDEPTPTSSPSSSGQPAPSRSTTNEPAVACPNQGDHGYVYYVSDLNGLGPRLYRTTVVETCTLGIEDMLTVPSGRDDDFTTLWPAGTTVNSVTVSGNVATVDLSAFPATGRVDETAAVQQLVWTVTANNPSITAVRVQVDGAPPVAHLDWSKPVRRGNSLATLSNVWILSPGNGTPQSSPVTIHIYGTGFEGQVPLKIFQDGVEVASSAVVTRMGGFAEASTTFDLPPGSYEVRAYNDNGQNGDLTLWDTKTFTVP